jgi:tRNA(fMet)-specific endonuclease VapC
VSIVEILRDEFEKGQNISIISVAELYEGIYATRNPKHEEALKNFLAGVVVLNMDEGVCRIFGRIRHELRRKGEMIDNFDLLIASTAIVYELTILTNNVKHFERIQGIEVLSESDFFG